MSNLELWNRVSEVPKQMQKTIFGGRLKGMTDIKPMWRVQKLTEEFGICGIGWKTKTIKEEIIDGAGDTKSAFVNIELFIKINGEWSDAIEGSGGSSFIASEKNGLYTSDECFKMAYTDALSVACKAIGIGANIYLGLDTKPIPITKSNERSKYDLASEIAVDKEYVSTSNKPIDKTKVNSLKAAIKNNMLDINDEYKSILKDYGYNKIEEIKVKDYMKVVEALKKKVGG